MLDLRISDYELLFKKIGKDDTCRCLEVDASKLPSIRDYLSFALTERNTMLPNRSIDAGISQVNFRW